MSMRPPAFQVHGRPGELGIRNSSIRSRGRRFLPFLVVFGAALTLRLILLLALRWEPHIIDDYDKIANSLVEHGVFGFDGEHPTVCRAPAYPLYLAFLRSIVGSTDRIYVWFRLADILLDSLSAVLVVFVFQTWFRGVPHLASVLSGALYALNPVAAFYTAKLGAETLATFFFLAYLFVLGMLVSRTGRTLTWTIAGGLAGGLLCLNKAVFLPLVFIGYASVLILQPRPRTLGTLTSPLLACLLCCSLVFAWSYRSSVAAGRAVIIQTLTGYNFWYDFSFDQHRTMALHARLDSSFTGDDPILSSGEPYRPYTLTANEDAKDDAALVQAAIRWSAAHPVLFMEKVGDNILSFWYAVESRGKMLVAGVSSLVLIVFGYKGARILISQGYRDSVRILAGFVVLLNLIYAPVFSVYRYSLSVIPILCMLSSPFLLFLFTAAATKLRNSHADAV